MTNKKRGHLDELAKKWAKMAQIPPTAEYHGMWWRIAMNSNADAISNRGNHESACIIYRAIIADARAEAEAT